jgi:hypothetical protein
MAALAAATSQTALELALMYGAAAISQSLATRKAAK